MSWAIAKGLFDLFVHRTDVHALQYVSRGEARFFKVDEELTVERIRQHLLGRITIGAYLIDKDETAKVLAFDVDPESAKEPRITAAELYFELIEYFPRESVWLECSRWPDDSYHVWLLLERYPAIVVRRLGLLIAKEVGFPVEIFPKQDEIHGAYGNLIKLPLGFHKAAKKWSKWVDPYTFEPLSNELILNAKQTTVPPWMLEEIERKVEEERTWVAQHIEIPSGLNLNEVPCVKAFRDTPIPPSYRHMTMAKNLAVLYKGAVGSWSGFEAWARELSANKPDFFPRDITGWVEWVDRTPRHVNCIEINKFLRNYADFDCDRCPLRVFECGFCKRAGLSTRFETIEGLREHIAEAHVLGRLKNNNP